jgi:hypothetical protein
MHARRWWRGFYAPNPVKSTTQFILATRVERKLSSKCLVDAETVHEGTGPNFSDFPTLPGPNPGFGLLAVLTVGTKVALEKT